ncbi:cupin domain-containing protein [Ancylobacter sp. SL191]|uniref:cupin domain-containing protein n=1 Tax=Ancylobacter sp. SL191 TaxID=2995166 RepID=UPI00226D581F|nr:cupin domain-containing protein [Ancylobacter sp. SL191]WAC25791.1 cupin domain-containing protein [Ancylobacter sp. SL191]
MPIIEPEARLFPPSGGVPNHPAFPVLIYHAALPADPSAIEEQVGANGWECRWRNGVFDYHHFHSTAHEALMVARGHATVQLGGSGGAVVEIAAGDALVLPAGTGHKRLAASADFLIIGAYPPGQDYEIERPDAAGLAAAQARIAAVLRPASDPVTGPAGALTRLWNG